MTDTQYSEYSIKLLRYVTQRHVDALRRGEEVPAYILAQLLEEWITRNERLGEQIAAIESDLVCVERIRESVEEVLEEVK